MSGIAGIVGNVADMEYYLAAMLRCQQHRGDDKGGFWISRFVDNRLGLACCSRTVSEVEEPVRQPYVDEETQLVVMADCDIYNYRELKVELQAKYFFSTDSSIEVLSKAYRMWGEEFLSRLKGSFVVVIYDRLKDVLLLARDRFGEKPLYYTTGRGVLRFASEVRPLIASGARVALSSERCAGYLLYSTYGPEYATFWDEVYQLPAGTLMVCNGYSLHDKQWYDLREDVAEWIDRCDEKSANDTFISVLEERAEHSLSDVSSCGLRVAERVESKLLHSIVTRSQYGWKVRSFTSEIEHMGRQPMATPVWLSGCDVVQELEHMHSWVEEPFDGRETLLRVAILRRAKCDGVKLLSSGLGLDVLWQELWDRGGFCYNYKSKPEIFSSCLASLATPPCYARYFGGDVEEGRCRELRKERLPHILRFMSRLSAEAGVAMRMPFLDDDLVAMSFALPMVMRRNRYGVFRDFVSPRHSCYVGGAESGGVMSSVLKQREVKEWVNDAISDLCRGRVSAWFDLSEMEKLRTRYNAGEECDEQLLWKCISLHRLLSVECRL